MISSNSPFSSNLVRPAARQKHAAPLILADWSVEEVCRLAHWTRAYLARKEVLPFSGMKNKGSKGGGPA